MNRAIVSIFIGISLLSLPLTAFAHGTAEEHAKENTINFWDYGLIASLVLVAIFLTLYIVTKNKLSKLNLKNKSNREKFKALQIQNKIHKWGSIISPLLAVIFLIVANIATEDKVRFTHIHGLGYTSDGEEIIVPAHDGLRVLKDGVWHVAEVDQNDYMGFTMFDNGFYSSGHPGSGSDLPNPLGIVRSTDKGKTIETLALTGEIDFHGMTVGYQTEEIYVFNPSQNSQMEQPGFYYSTDQTKTWKQSKLAGLEGQALALSAHPSEQGVVALATNQGVFLSTDYGDNFEKLPITGAVSAVSFGHQNNLLVATQTDLYHYDLSSTEATKLSIPNLGEAYITYIKQDPANKEEFVFATSNRDIYLSSDGGNTWEQSVDNGVAITQ